MKHQFRKSLIICLAAALCCAGCAKHELVKQDSLLPAAAPATAPAPAEAMAAKAIVPEDAKPAAQNSGLSTSGSSDAQAADQAAKAAARQSAKDGALQGALDKVFFDFDSHTLSPAARAVLAKNAEILKKKASFQVRIEGNCDELGSDDYNLSLGESRARAALNYLQSLGIPSNRISVISYGKEKPAASGHDEDSRAKNRRDEFVVTSN